MAVTGLRRPTRWQEYRAWESKVVVNTDSRSLTAFAARASEGRERWRTSNDICDIQRRRVIARLVAAKLFVSRLTAAS